MKVSREQMAQNRARILSEAGRLFREKGFQGVSVAEVMKAAGLTHGGFYGHFASKDDLVAEVISQAAGDQAVDFESFLEAYLSPSHREHPEHGCPMAALAGLMRDQAPEARAAMGRRLSDQLNAYAKLMPGEGAAEKRRAAIGSFAAMVGAMVLSRSVDEPQLAAELLDETRAWISKKA